MKLSKSLLSAILVGIAVQTLPACKKETLKTSETPKSKWLITAPHPTPAPCPACGLG